MQAVRKLTTFVQMASSHVAHKALEASNKLKDALRRTANKNKNKKVSTNKKEPTSAIEAISTVNSSTVKFKNGSRFTNHSLEESKIDQIAAYRINKLKQLEHQRERIQRSIRAVDNQIGNLRVNHKDSAFQRRLDISQDSVAYSQAQMLVHRMNAQKRIIQQRRELKERLKLVELERAQRIRMEQQSIEKQRILEERRVSIAKRLHLEEKRREQMKQLNSMSNQLIRQIKKINNSKHMTEPSEPVTKRRHTEHVDLTAEINEHTKKYMQIRHKLTQKSIEEKTELTPRKYYKGRINRVLEEEDQLKKKLDEEKHEQPYIQLQKRKKYGQLVKTLINVNRISKPPTASLNASHNVSHDVSHDRKQSNHTNFQRILTQQQIEAPKKRRSVLTDQQMRLREKQLRRENRLKMKELVQIEQLQKSKVSKPTPLSEKYKDYLKELPRMKQNDREMVKRIMEDKSLTKEDKYVEVMQKAAMLEHKAKMKEETLKNVTQNDEVVGLIVSSIQAKLALLDSL